MGQDNACLCRQPTHPEIRQHSRSQFQKRKKYMGVLKKIDPIKVQDEGPDEQDISMDKISSIKHSPTLGFNEDYIKKQTDDNEEVQLKKVQVKWNDFIKMKKKKFSDDYYIMTQIGKGGFGSVYKVMMKNGNLLRAAKKIEKSLLKPEEHENLLGEMSIMMSLDHPNIAKLYEVYDQSSYYVMVMELCEGGELFERIINEKIEEEESIIIIKQILSALNYMHTQGIIHRDIKPENMLFEKSSKRLKLIDFGISTKLAPGESLNQRVGTPYYIAPEVLLKRYNEKSDLWSTGVVAFMIVTGKPPFKGRDPQEVMQKIVMDDVAFSKRVWGKRTPECVDFVQKLLKKKPRDRMSAKKALEHPWIINYTPQKKSLSNQTQLIERMKKFRFKNKLQAVVHTFIASQLLSNQLKSEILQYFNSFDKNQNGVIEIEELREALSQNPALFKGNDAQIRKILDYIDTNCSGKIDYTEFVVAATNFNVSIKQEHFEQAFAYFDIDRSGEITFEEISQFLDEESTSAIKQIFLLADENGDGLISKEQFVKLLMHRHS